jgi:hypothetical protein
LNYKRVRCEDPKIIIEWFNLVQKTICDYGIDSDDIYNFDKTGFAIGLATTVKVIARAEYSQLSLIVTPPRQAKVVTISENYNK